MGKLDDIFDDNIEDEHPYGTEYDMPAVKQAIKDLMLDIVGEDDTENLFHKENPLWLVRNQVMWNRNDLRQQLRQKIEEI